MKRITIILSFLVGLTAWGQNSVSLGGGSGHPGDVVTVSVALENSDAVTALQTFVPLGSQLRYVSGSATLGSRSNGHQVSATVLRDTLRIYSYSLALSAYTGTSGEVLTFQLTLGNEPGDYALTPTATVLSSSTGAALPVAAVAGNITIRAPKAQLSPATLDYGHVPIRSTYTRTVTLTNIGNEPLTLNDVECNAEALTASPTTGTLAAGASQTVTLTYRPVAAGAVSMNATFHTDAGVGDKLVSLVADPYSVNELRPLSCSGFTDSIVTIELRMNNMDSIVGLQTSLRLPVALTYVDGSFVLDAARKADHVAMAGLQGDTLTLVVTSLTNSPLHGGDGVVARFQLRLHGYGGYTLSLMETALSDATGANVLSDVYTGSVSIYSPYLSCANNVDLGSTPVTDTASATLSLQNYGNAPLVVERVAFLQSHWRVVESLPLTVENYGSATLTVECDLPMEGSHQADMLLYTNDPRNDLKRVTVTAQRYEPNNLYLTGNASAPASTPEVDIVLDNYSDVTALQMDVTYPHEHFTLEPADISLSSRSNGHIVTAARMDDSTLRVLMLSMQNAPFSGNSGAVARMQLHASDSTSTAYYPVSIHNVSSVSPDGVNRLSHYEDTTWFATRVIHDTTLIEIHDTIIEKVRDTTLVNYYVYDTTIVNVFDTTLVNVKVFDTTIVNVFDTTIVNTVQYDTTLVNVYDTTIVNYYQYDTTVVNNYQYDTSIFNHYRFDTTMVFDTMIVNVYTYDTSIYNNYQFDTVILNTYRYDTTLVSVKVFDTTIVNLFDTTMVNIYDTTIVNHYQYDTTLVSVKVFDTTIVNLFDTTIVNLFDTTMVNIYDTTIVNYYQYDTTLVSHVYQYDTSIFNHYRYDTTMVFDTMIVNIYSYDTSIYNNYRFDTVMLVTYQYDTTLVYDTIIQNFYQYDTTMVNLYDTTIVNFYLYDTLIVNTVQYDTSIFNHYRYDTTMVFDTMIVNVYTYDTSIYNNYQFDTVILNIYRYDTTLVSVYDTVIQNYYQYDTTIVNIYDTTINNNYQYDTIIVNNYFYDTVYNYYHDTVNNYYWDTVVITNTFHDTIIVNNYIYDTIYLNRYIHDTIYIHDTVYVEPQGIGDVETIDAKIYQRNGSIVVEGAQDHPVFLYDAVGRLVGKNDDGLPSKSFSIPASGTYLIKIGNYPAKRFVALK